MPFALAWADQRRWQERLMADREAPEAVWILQHPPCYTLGRGASLEHLHFDVAQPPFPLHHIDRGGEVTHHLPGQIVVYPVLDLQRRTPDLHVYLRQLEQLLIDVLAELVNASRHFAAYTGAGISTSAGIGDYASRSDDTMARRLGQGGGKGAGKGKAKAKAKANDGTKAKAKGTAKGTTGATAKAKVRGRSLRDRRPTLAHLVLAALGRTDCQPAAAATANASASRKHAAPR